MDGVAEELMSTTSSSSSSGLFLLSRVANVTTSASDDEEDGEDFPTVGEMLDRVGHPSYASVVPDHWLRQRAPSRAASAAVAAAFLALVAVNNACGVLLAVVFVR